MLTTYRGAANFPQAQRCHRDFRANILLYSSDIAAQLRFILACVTRGRHITILGHVMLATSHSRETCACQITPM